MGSVQTLRKKTGSHTYTAATEIQTVSGRKEHPQYPLANTRSIRDKHSLPIFKGNIAITVLVMIVK